MQNTTRHRLFLIAWRLSNWYLHIKNAKSQRIRHPCHWHTAHIEDKTLRLQGALRADGCRGNAEPRSHEIKIKINPLIDKDLIKRGWCRLTNGGENPAQAHFASYSEEKPPSSLQYMITWFHLDGTFCMQLATSAKLTQTHARRPSRCAAE